MVTFTLLCLSVWRISSPMGVPPGSRNTRTRCPSARSRSANNSTCVDLPQPSVPSKVINRVFMQELETFNIQCCENWMFGVRCWMFDVFSNLLQLWPLGRVFNNPAFGLQFVADRVGAFEILRLARGLPRFEQCGQPGGNFNFVRRANAENGINFVPRRQRRGCFGCA